MRLTRILVLAALAGAFICGACDDDTAPPVPVASVDVTPAADTVRAGLTTELTATPRDAQGNALTGRTITWSSDAEAVATVDETGLVTGVSAGTAMITAESEGESGSADVTVWVGITGSWSGTVDAPPGLCPFSMSITEDAAGNITGTGELFAPCVGVTFDVDGTNNTDAVPDSVFIDYSEPWGGSIQFDGMFDGDATLTGVMNEYGCCDYPTTFTRESIAPGPPAQAAAREERPRNPVERPLLRKRPGSR